MFDFKKFNQEKASKKQVMYRLLSCAVGLNVCFLSTGVLQERLLTKAYGDEFFTSR